MDRTGLFLYLRPKKNWEKPTSGKAKEKIRKKPIFYRLVVEAAIEAGIYVIIDWHDHEGAAHRNDAIAFFEQMARDYGKYPHVIYETFNEPLNVDWVSVVKPYHEAVLKAIRAIDADNLVVLGTPDWSGSPEKAKASPVSGTNILYTVHFYTGADAAWQEFQRNRVAEYVKGGFPIFITEYGVSKEDGGKTGGIYTDEANKWFSMLDSNKIAYANWAMDDAPEASAALKPGTSPTAVGQDSSLTDSGKFIKAKLRSMNLGVSCSGSSPSPAPAPAPVPSPPASGSGKVAVSVKQTASWNGGGQADIVVTNNGDAKVCGATLQLSSGKIASFWNLVSSDNKNFTPQYQMNLAKGQSYTAGGVFEGAVPSFKVASTKNC
ncbi:beta-1,4-endoglucanase [Aphelenchoides avenae]|nr:beta-1,4-endoglucanase [Aphelenchus avenae]